MQHDKNMKSIPFVSGYALLRVDVIFSKWMGKYTVQRLTNNQKKKKTFFSAHMLSLHDPAVSQEAWSCINISNAVILHFNLDRECHFSRLWVFGRFLLWPNCTAWHTAGTEALRAWMFSVPVFHAYTPLDLSCKRLDHAELWALVMALQTQQMGWWISNTNQCHVTSIVKCH